MEKKDVETTASRQIHIRISQATHRKLRFRAAELDTTIQDIVVKAIDLELKRPPTKKAER